MRLAGSNRDDTWRRIRSAGIDLLFEIGYDTMNTRQLAEAADLKPGSLYYYFSSKEEFLYRVLTDLLEEIVEDLEDNLAPIPPEDIPRRLDTFIQTLVSWHVTRHKETFIASIETRALSRDRHESYLRLRDKFDTTLDAILADGKDAGVFDISNVTITRHAILSMITAISGWYDPSGPLKIDDITREYVELARRMTGSADSAP